MLQSTLNDEGPDEGTWQLDEARLIADVANEVGWGIAALESGCDRVGIRGELKLVHGHDALKILAVGLKTKLGSANIGARTLCADLRLAFESASLAHKRLASQLKSWAGARTLI